ncbi:MULTISPECIES: DUF1822 family protein [unclassified Microcoleus]|uniref:DUF1822 family protein n=1 Tax=unclassified Microcoleus TaxID=2642155 RepID=UPI002FCF1DAA
MYLHLSASIFVIETRLKYSTQIIEPMPQKRKKLRGLLATDNGCKILQDTRTKKGYSYEKLAEVAAVNVDQVKRLSHPHWNYPVQRDAIEKIAKVLDLHPTDIVDPNQWYPPLTGQEIRVGAKMWIDPVVFEKMPPDIIVEITRILEKIPGNISIQINRIQEGSLIVFFETSPEGFEQIQNRFITGELAQLLNREVRDVRLDYVIEPPVNLDTWFQNNFIEAIEAGWLTFTEILGIRRLQESFRSNTVQRAQRIQLGDRTLALILDLEKQDEQTISLFLGIYPIEEQTDLPEDLKLTVFFDSGEPVEIIVNEDRDGFKQEIFFSPGEEFSLQVTSGEDSITEDFQF